MADKATASSSASIFLDEIKSSIGGNLNYEPADTGDKWVFAEIAVNADANLLSTTHSFLKSGTALVVGDKIRWIAIKNLSTTATDGVCISLDGGTPAYDLADGIFIGAGEIVMLKVPNVTCDLMHAASVTMDGTYGYPASANSDPVNVHVAAIIDDVS